MLYKWSKCRGGVNMSYLFSAVLRDYTYLCHQIGYASPLGA